MNNLTLNKSTKLIGLFLAVLAFSFNANASCAKTGDAITTVSGNSATSVTEGETASDACSETPDFYKLKFYKMGLCTADPSGNDLSSCQYIMNDATGVDHVISYPSTGEMDIPQFSITLGTYPYMVGVLSNKLGIKHSITTTNAIDGSDGDGTGGTYCWTANAGPSAYTNEVFTSDANTHNEATVSGSTKLINCATTAGTAIYSYEIINKLSGDACSDAWAASGDKLSMGNVGNGTAVVSLLKYDNSFATACEDAGRILWTTTLTTSAVVTTDSTFELKMRSQDAVSVDFDSGAGNNDIMKMGADPIQLYLTVN
jgi:hypothetical protein